MTLGERFRHHIRNLKVFVVKITWRFHCSYLNTKSTENKRWFAASILTIDSLQLSFNHSYFSVLGADLMDVAENLTTRQIPLGG